MTVFDVTLDSIDLGDQTFRISEELDCPLMQASVREVGVLNPVLLSEAKGRRILVCGFRRLHALQAIGGTRVPARLMPADGSRPLDLFRLAILDNLPHREFTPLEKARILHTLETTCLVPHEVLIQTWLALLGLPAHKNVLYVYLRLHLMDPGLRELFNSGRLSPASIERLSGATREEQGAFAELLSRTRLTASRQRELLELAEELSAITGTALTDVLRQPEIQAVLDDTRRSPFQKGEQICEHLYRLRNPRLSGARERFEQMKQSLGLPGSIRVSPDPYFETTRLRFAFDAGSARDFRELTSALSRAAGKPCLEDLFEKTEPQA